MNMKKPNVDLSAIKERLSRPLNRVICEINNQYEEPLEIQQPENKMIFDSLERINEKINDLQNQIQEIKMMIKNK